MSVNEHIITSSCCAKIRKINIKPKLHEQAVYFI